MITTRNLRLTQGGRVLLDGLDLQLEAGQGWIVLGENGCGKSTLLAALAGWHKPAGGQILLQGRALASWPARERAQQMAWMPQDDACPFPLTVLDKTLTGRYPHQQGWQPESTQDVALAHAALQRLDLAGLAGRDLLQLSGGERRRTALATALVQQAPLLLLDEPLGQLDVRHQLQALAVLEEERRAGRCVVMISHDPNHARHFATHTLLLAGDGQYIAGVIDDVLTESVLSALYHCNVQSVAQSGQRWFMPVANGK